MQAGATQGTAQLAAEALPPFALAAHRSAHSYRCAARPVPVKMTTPVVSEPGSGDGEDLVHPHDCEIAVEPQHGAAVHVGDREGEIPPAPGPPRRSLAALRRNALGEHRNSTQNRWPHAASPSTTVPPRRTGLDQRPGLQRLASPAAASQTRRLSPTRPLWSTRHLRLMTCRRRRQGSSGLEPLAQRAVGPGGAGVAGGAAEPSCLADGHIQTPIRSPRRSGFVRSSGAGSSVSTTRLCDDQAGPA